MPTTAVEFRDSSIFGKTTVFQAVSPPVGSIVHIACDKCRRDRVLAANSDLDGSPQL